MDFLQIENQNGRRGGGDEVPPPENQRPDDDPGLLELPHNPHHHCCPHFLLRWGPKHKKLQTEGKGDDAKCEALVNFSFQGEHKEGDECSHWNGNSWRERGYQSKVMTTPLFTLFSSHKKPPMPGTRLIWENEARERRWREQMIQSLTAICFPTGDPKNSDHETVTFLTYLC